MSPGIEETIWELKPHTLVKHKILIGYLNGWLPKISKFKKANYIDGFAGPGIYVGDKDGSPIIALKAAIDHKLDLSADFNFIFIESRKDRYDVLNKILNEKYSGIRPNFKWYPVHGEFDSHVNGILDEIERKGAKLAPTLAFIDPFGFTGFPMSSIKRILSYDSCEVFVNLMENFVNRFNDERREDALDELYGTDEWRAIPSIENPEARKRAWLDLYVKQLVEEAGAVYTRSFEMVGDTNQTIYYLVFATKNIEGLRVMKEAMWKADRTGGYRFSDLSDPRQKVLLDYNDEDTWVSDAATDVYSSYAGKTAKVEDIEKYVLVDTPYLFRKKILIKLEKDGKVKNVDGRQKKIYISTGLYNII